MKNSNLSADSYIKILNLDRSTPEPSIRSGDTGQRIPCLDSCQFMTTLHDVQSVFSWAPKLARKCESMVFPVVRTDARAVGVRHVMAKCSGMGRFTQLGAPLTRAREWSSATTICLFLGGGRFLSSKNFFPRRPTRKMFFSVEKQCKTIRNQSNQEWDGP